MVLLTRLALFISSNEDLVSEQNASRPSLVSPLNYSLSMYMMSDLDRTRVKVLFSMNSIILLKEVCCSGMRMFTFLKRFITEVTIPLSVSIPSSV